MRHFIPGIRSDRAYQRKLYVDLHQQLQTEVRGKKAVTKFIDGMRDNKSRTEEQLWYLR